MAPSEDDAIIMPYGGNPAPRCHVAPRTTELSDAEIYQAGTIPNGLCPTGTIDVFLNKRSGRFMFAQARCLELCLFW